MKLSEAELYNLVLKVNKAFYERVYKDEWMSQIFRGVGQDHIEHQQTDFMVAAFGGPDRFFGKIPKDAHPHIYVDEEMWNLREKFLLEALEEVQAPAWMRDKWVKIDNSFKAKIMKNSVADCQKRYFSDEIINIPKPIKRAG